MRANREEEEKEEEEGEKERYIPVVISVVRFTPIVVSPAAEERERRDKANNEFQRKRFNRRKRKRKRY